MKKIKLDKWCPECKKFFKVFNTDIYANCPTCGGDGTKKSIAKLVGKGEKV